MAKATGNQRRLTVEQGRKLLLAQATHGEIQSAVTEYLDWQRIPYGETDAALAFNLYGQRIERVTEGWPDVTACFPGGVMAPIEVKTAGDHLRPDQARILYRLLKQGAICIIARSVDDVIEARRLGRTRPKDVEEIIKFKDLPDRKREPIKRAVKVNRRSRRGSQTSQRHYSRVKSRF